MPTNHNLFEKEGERKRNQAEARRLVQTGSRDLQSLTNSVQVHAETLRFRRSVISLVRAPSTGCESETENDIVLAGNLHAVTITFCRHIIRYPCPGSSCPEAKRARRGRREEGREGERCWRAGGQLSKSLDRAGLEGGYAPKPFR